MQTETTRLGVRRVLAAARAEGKRVALVPTMGFLHEGHLSLVDRAHQLADAVVMSIFVNPLQFGPAEDFTRYPRDPERDARLAAQRGVQVLFVPADQEMYPLGRPAVTVIARELAEPMEGQFRPGHFEGVLTVVAKLLNIVQPAVAVFGQKDFQQCALVQRMCADLDFPVAIDIMPTVREPDGLALSSRNVYLNDRQRQSALVLSQGLRAAQAQFAGGERNPAALVRAARALLERDPAVAVQYVELVDPLTMRPPPASDVNSVMAVAAVVGTTRLIDNIRMGA